MSKRIIALAALFLALFTASFGAGAGPQFTVALQGYDPVSYFEGSTPQKGDFMHAVHWNGTTWLFANDERAKRFKASPTKYAPQFDGYCALAKFGRIAEQPIERDRERNQIADISGQQDPAIAVDGQAGAAAALVAPEPGLAHAKT